MAEPSKFPYFQYLPLPLLTIAWFAAQQWLQLQTWWVTVPWFYITGGVALFLAGMLWADLSNPGSRLLRWWRTQRCVFEVTAISTNHTWDDARREETERIEIWCLLRFLQNLDDPLLTIRAIGPLEVPAARQKTSVVLQERLGEVVKDATKRFSIGAVGVSRAVSQEDHAKAREEGRSMTPHPTRWASGSSIIPSSKNRVEITINNGHPFCSFVAFIDHSDDRLGRVLIIREDEGISF